MASVKPSIPKGTRDFSPEQVAKRNYIFNTIRSVFEKYGYQPIETPTMEMLSTLTGKYGDEGDKLLFKVLNSGNFLDGVSNDKLAPDNYKQLTTDISEKGLRYDLTVPFARYVVMHQNEITFPFKRYQIQPVFRADRPQRGRYREFYQCDADVVGSDSLLNEVELIQIYDEVFTKLGIDVTIKINNRKVLYGITEVLGIKKEHIVEFITEIDKFDKMGIDRISNDMFKTGIIDPNKNELFQLIFKFGSAPAYGKKDVLDKIMAQSEIGKLGFKEIESVIEYLTPLKLKSKIEFEFSLARGLNYYTGAIIEVKANNIQMGSIGGGGRYDDLTGVFGLPNVSGVGISFGADRIYDVLEELKLFPETITTATKVLFVNFDEKSAAYILPLLQKVRTENIPAELYPSPDKMKKQLGYADAKKIPFVVLAGEDEMKEGKLTLKNMASGEQEKLTIDEIIEQVISQL